MSSPEAAGPAASPPPDWSTLTLELHCPRCGYNLRMLTGSRCPECGLDLDWAAIIAGARDVLVSPFFEQQWRSRPVRSLLHTFRFSFRPKVLWSQMPLASPVAPGPLGALVLLTLVLDQLAVVATDFAVSVHWRLTFASTSSAWRLPKAWLLVPSLRQLAVCALLTVVMPLSWLFLQVFRRTLMRWRVKQSQLLRVLVLAWVPMVLLKTAATSITTWWFATRLYRSPGQIWNDASVLAAGDIAAVALFTYSMAFGLARYLRLRRGQVAAIAVVWLSMQTWATLDIVYSVIAGRWDNELAMLTFDTWPGITQLVGGLLGL